MGTFSRGRVSREGYETPVAWGRSRAGSELKPRPDTFINT